MTRPANKRRRNLSDNDLHRIITKQLPAWTRACTASNANAIVLHESAFGRSRTELLLLACAIKYAALHNKSIHIVCGDSARRTDAALTNRAKARVLIYREQRASRSTKHT